MTVDYEKQLNPAQLRAATTTQGPVLVIAGAGSGKTRTIVYRLSYLMDLGVPAETILLLTFTRKAAQEMLTRASYLQGGGLGSGLTGGMGGAVTGVAGGTFHSFAYGVLRRHGQELYGRAMTIMDQADAQGVVKEVKAELKLGRGDRSYPKVGTVHGLISKARNKELSLEDCLAKEAFHLLKYTDDFTAMEKAYHAYKAERGLLDYDDLLFELERHLRDRPELLALYRNRYRHVMVDEYQDTNLVQARLVKLLAGDGGSGGEGGSVMAVGDDAQSIYAFRGADVANILQFPQDFPGAEIIKLEQNYRSTQPILALTNDILAGSPVGYAKRLFSERQDTALPRVVRTLSDLTQAKAVADAVAELLKTRPASDVAVLFRAGFHSYQVEVAFNKLGVPFRKYGGLKYTEAAHIKDVLAFLRLAVNASDAPAWTRAMALAQGVGPATAKKLMAAVMTGDAKYLTTWRGKKPELGGILDLLDALRNQAPKPLVAIERVMDLYGPMLPKLFPDDYTRREQGLEELMQIASAYEAMDLFLADLSLENPDQREDDGAEYVTLSTIHSAKGLEWPCVMVIDLVEERFPSRHSMHKADDFEEERRLMYVACTRAMDDLRLFAPMSLYRRGAGMTEPAVPSPFVREIAPHRYEEYKEAFSGQMCLQAGRAPDDVAAPQAGRDFGARSDCPTGSTGVSVRPAAGEMRHCRHSTFGRGKIIQILDGGKKYRVNFEGFGLKVILADYVQLEDAS